MIVLYPLLGVVLAVLTNPLARSAVSNHSYVLIPIVVVGDILHVAILLGLMTYHFWFTFREHGYDLSAAFRWSAPFAFLPPLSYLLGDIGRFGMLLEIVAFAVAVHHLLARQQNQNGRSLATVSRVVGFTVVALVANWTGKVPLFAGILVMKSWLQ